MTTRASEACDAGASAIAAGIACGAIFAGEVVEETLRRIAAANPVINAFTEVYTDDARARAAEIDRTGMKGALAGVPVAVKDFTPLEGKRTTYGSLAYKDNIADYTPVYVRRLEAAGAVIIGKTNTPEFAHASFTANRVFGATLNPWDLSRTPGGSSGGAGAAVASGCVPLAEGTDMGGSVRIPASYCGIVGLKPALGRIPMDILPTGFDQISHFGPLARSVEDAALFLSVTMGPDDADPLSLPAQEIAFDPGAGVEGLRIALSPDLGYYAVAPDVAVNFAAAAEALRGMGAVVTEVEIGWDRGVNDRWTDHWAVYLAAAQGHLLATHRDQLDPEMVAFFEAAPEFSALDVKAWDVARTAMWRRLAEVFATHDALICPTTNITAPPVERTDSDFGGDDGQGRYLGVEMTSPFNLVAPCPAITVPSGRDRAGLPTAVQIVGRRHDELTALRIAQAVEAAALLESRPPRWVGGV